MDFQLTAIESELNQALHSLRNETEHETPGWTVQAEALDHARAAILLLTGSDPKLILGRWRPTTRML